MKFIPAIDLKDNRCVRLEKGSEERLTIFNNNPVEQAKYFEDSGCQRLHLVDLDGAFGRPEINKKTILNIRKKINIPIELGGGIKNKEDVFFWIDEGIDFLVLGSLAIKNSDLVLEFTKMYPNKIYIALDVLGEKIMIKGWVEDSNRKIQDIFNTFNSSLVRGFILTDISRDGMLQGLDQDLINKQILKTQKNIIVGGGLSNYQDLINLNKNTNKNLEGVIAGKAFYSGNIEIKKSLEILKYNA